MADKKLPVILGSDPFGEEVVGVAELVDGKIVITVEDQNLFEEANKFARADVDKIRSTDEIVGFALSFAYLPVTPKIDDSRGR